MEILLKLQKYSQQPISTQILLLILKEYARPYDKIDELEEKGYLIQLRRGLYILGEKLNVQQPELTLLSNHLYGPSYISLETALFFWGLIPEKVYVTTAMTIKPTTRFDTKLGTFTYQHLSTPYYSYGIQTIMVTEKQSILIGSPEKSICDKIITTPGILLRSIKQASQFLIDDLRIDIELLSQMNTQEFECLIPVCSKKGSIEKVIELIHVL
jgi:predicted transcriptional regulator of viral defense system